MTTILQPFRTLLSAVSLLVCTIWFFAWVALFITVLPTIVGAALMFFLVPFRTPVYLDGAWR